MATTVHRMTRAAVLVLLSLLLISSQAGAASSFNEEFKAGRPLAARWQWYQENPAHWSLTAHPGWLRIWGVNEMAGSCAPVENLLLTTPPSGDFKIVARIKVKANVDYQHGGILVFRDVDNYIKLDKLYNSAFGGGSVEFVKEENGVFPTSWPHHSANLAKAQDLQLKRRGNTLTALDRPVPGTTWRKLGKYSLSGLNGFRIGLFAFAGCNTGAPPAVADFDWFRVTTS